MKVLSGMEADQQVDGVDSIESYTRTWTQIIDCGGLYQVKEDVSIKRYLYGTLNDAVKNQKILSAWELVAPLPSKYEPYSIELLQAIIALWTNVRCFAFAKGWNEQFEKKFHKDGARSTLKKDRKRNQLSHDVNVGNWLCIHIHKQYTAIAYIYLCILLRMGRG